MTGYDDTAFGYGNVMGCGEPDDDDIGDRRDPTGANDRRDGKDRRAWRTPYWRPWLTGDRKRSRTRRQSDRRGGE